LPTIPLAVTLLTIVVAGWVYGLIGANADEDGADARLLDTDDGNAFPLVALASVGNERVTLWSADDDGTYLLS
jgi:hypothetical protein